MRIESVAEELVCAGAITLADGAAGVVKGPAGYGDAEGDEGFFFEATGEFLPAVFFKEIGIERGGERCVGHLGLGMSKMGRGRYQELWVMRSCKHEVQK